MENKGWDRTIIINEQLKEYSWEKGFFQYTFGDNPSWKRNFEELRQRDISLFSLGHIEGKKVLDVGCGEGLYVMVFLLMGAKEVCGQDISERDINICIDRTRSKGFSNYVGKVGDCAELQFEDNYFDVIFSGDVFEHITDEQKENAVLEAYRVLRPGGLFTIKTPNKKYLKLTNLMRRLKAAITLKNPFDIHIAHTRNNPDNEHHGLVDHKGMLDILGKTMFHEPVITYQAIQRKGFPAWLSKRLRKSLYFNQNLIITVQKPLFYGFYE